MASGYEPAPVPAASSGPDEEPVLSDPADGEELMLLATRESSSGSSEWNDVDSSPILIPNEDGASFAEAFNEQMKLPGVDGYGGEVEASAEAKILPDDKVQWMWADANALGPLLRGIGNSLATHNPARWSKWQPMDAAVADLQKHADKQNKPVKLRCQRNHEILSFDTVDEAITALRPKAQEQQAAELKRKPVPAPETKVAFSPGAHGMVIDKDSGRVDGVEVDGQAQKKGVLSGMTAQRIDGEPYSCELLDEKVGGKEDYEIAFVEEWGVAHRRPKKNRLSMIIPAVTRVGFSLVGATAVGAGYGVGKLGEVVTGNKAVDSATFRAGFTSYLWSNGIFPTMQYESLGTAEEQLTREYGIATPPQPQDNSLTPVIVSNHVSYLDGLVLASVFGAPKIMAKAGARNTPVFGKLMEEMEVVFVKREDGNSRQAALDAISTHCTDWKPGMRPLLIFPEGTTTNGEVLAPFKKGAFSAGTPVRPVVIVYTGDFDPSNPHFVETENGIEEASDKEWAARFFGAFIHSMHIRVLAPYFPNEKEKTDAAFYAANFQNWYATEFARVREEVQSSSWKVAAGRTGGGIGYQPGDVIRIGARAVVNKTRAFGSGLGQFFVRSKSFQCILRDKTEDNTTDGGPQKLLDC